jgi:hypothetical protein
VPPGTPDAVTAQTGTEKKKEEEYTVGDTEHSWHTPLSLYTL